MPKLRTLAAMPVAESLAVAEAAVLLFAARIAIEVAPLHRWSRAITSASPGNGATGGEAARVAAVAVERAVRRASRNLPGTHLCLPQALAGRWMLARRDIESQLYLGTRRRPDGALDHHAWLKVGAWWVTGHCNEREYAVFRTADRARSLPLRRKPAKEE